jgi:hypothetical protein
VNLLIYIVELIIAVLLCYKYGDWKNWRKYHSTILFFIIGDLTYNFFTYNKPLWTYVTAFTNHTIICLIIAIILFPCTVLIYIPHYPKLIVNRILYNLIWVSIYTIMEIIWFMFGNFRYTNGWNIHCSFIFNCVLFPLLFLHYKKPILAYIITFAFTIIGLIFFHIDLGTMR